MSQAASENKQTIFLKDYTPSEYLIEHVELDIELKPEISIVKTNLQISKNPSSPLTTDTLVLNGEDIILKEIKINDRLLDSHEYNITDNLLHIPNVKEQIELQLIQEICPEKNTALSGLYKSSGIYCTQCEAEGFRRISYFIDRPDIMATYKVTIHADKQDYPVLLSNGNLVASGNEAGRRHYAVWEDPFKKPCYLFALVAGDLVGVEDNYLTLSGKLVKLKIFVERPNLSQTPHALAALKKAMQWDEQAYGREYDLDVYMIVAVNDFNMGAMENKGLNIFNSRFILASPDTATDRDFAYIDIVVGHEYFHNWSGNRVTCRDWFQLSLKEGFTVFREQQFTASITKSPVVRIDEVKNMLTRQFPEDAGPMAHPVRPSSYLEINNFYTVTIYEKGAEVIRMLHTLLGAKKFRRGADLYFSRFDGHAVTTDDFVAAMQEASGVDLNQFKLWYSQAGTPVVTVQDKYDPATKEYTISMTQTIPDTPGQTNKVPMHIPVRIGLIDDNGKDISIQNDVLSLQESSQKFVLEDIGTKPHLSVFRNFSAPVKVQREISNEELAFLASFDSDTCNRWLAAQELYIKTLLLIIKDIQNNTKPKEPLNLLKMFGAILADTEINLSLKAELLQLPSIPLLMDKMDVADPDATYMAKKFVVAEIYKNYKPQIHEQYYHYQIPGPYEYNEVNTGKRSCRNLMLGYIVSQKDEDGIVIADNQYNHANNMTDKIASLSALAGIECNQRIEALINFHENWFSDPLVINKWLTVQATSDLDNCLEQVKELMQHKSFDIKNPNKVNALVGGFTSGNPVKFHAKDGSGYEFLADVVLQLNNLNPQVAARMLLPMTHWQRFDSQRQEKMRAQLTRIKDNDNLCPDVLEVVTKALSSN